MIARTNKRVQRFEYQKLEPRKLLAGDLGISGAEFEEPEIDIPSFGIIGSHPIDSNSIIDPNVLTSAFTGVVSIQILRGTTSSICTGTLISNHHVLTAAHCFTNKDGEPNADESQVRVAFNHDSPGEARDAESLELHPSWSGENDNFHDDLAIIELSEAAPVEAGIYPFADQIPGLSGASEVVLAGYGLTGSNNLLVSGTSSFTTKRVGFNVASRFYADDEGSDLTEVFESDFDFQGSGDLFNDGGAVTGEVAIGQGDSGGPAFTWNDDGDGIIEHPELSLYGTNTYNFGNEATGVVTKSGGQDLNNPNYRSWIRGIVETDSSLSDANEITERVTAGSLIDVDDQDHYSFVALPGQTYRIETELLGLRDSTLSLMNSNGSVLASSNNYPGGGLASRIIWTAPDIDGTDPETFTIRVDNFSDSNSDSGSYNLILSDSPSAPRPIISVFTQSQFLTPEDVDFYSIDVIAGVTYTIQSRPGNIDGTLSDLESIEISVRDDQGFLVSSVSGPRDLVWTAQSSGSALVRASSDSAGFYGLVASSDRSSVPRAERINSGFISGGGDSDVFAFAALPGESIHFELDAANPAFLELRVLDSEGQELLRGNEELTFVASADAVYFVEVSSVEGFGGSQTYTLFADQLSDDFTDIFTLSDEELELDTITSGRIGTSFDTDYFQFEPLELGQTYNIQVNFFGVNSLDPTLEVVDNTGEAVSITGSSGSVSLPFTPENLEPFFIGVSTASSSFRGTGVYEITVSLDDHGDNIQTATDLRGASSISGVIEEPGDEDYFRLTAEQGDIFSFRLNSDSSEAPQLVLRDENRNILEADFNNLDFDFDSGFFSYFTGIGIFNWEVPSTGDYYLSANFYDITEFDPFFGTSGLQSVGNYELRVIKENDAAIVSSVLRDGGGTLSRPDLLNAFSVSFDVDVNISADDLAIRNDTLGGTIVDSSGLMLDYDAATHTATWDFGSLTLDPGFYSFELSDDIVSVDGNVSLDGNLDGNPGGAFIETVYVTLPGDANLDGQVNVLDDAFSLVGNLGTIGGAVWADGDFNGDGNVDVLGDAFILIGRLGQSVVPPSAGTSAKQAFASAVITNEPAIFVSKQKDERWSAQSSLPSHQLALAGSQDIDTAFEPNGLIDDGLF